MNIANRRERLRALQAGTLGRADMESLLDELAQVHGFGNPIPDCRCPNCGKAIVLTWNFGLSHCLAMLGGCNTAIGVPMNRSALHST